MPELPEVEAQRRTLEAVALNTRIALLVANEQGGGPRDGEFDDKIMEGLTPGDLATSVQGRWVLAVKRRGKQLWVELGDTKGGACRACLLLHFGMTGAMIVRGMDAPQYKNFSIDTSVWPPRFTKLELVLDDGKGGAEVFMAFTDPRRFGRILLRGADPFASPPLSGLAADPITDPLPLDEFRVRMSKSKAPVKAVLLDQAKVFCGVGNWVADEVLYHAAVLPSAPCNELSDEQTAAVYAQVLAVCKTACEANADSDRFPPGWMFHHRWQGQTSGSMDSPLGRIHFDTVGGRTTAFVPAKQKRAQGASKPAEAPEPKAAKGKKRKAKAEAEAEAEEKAGPAADEAATSKIEVDLTLDEDDEAEDAVDDTAAARTKPVAKPKGKRAKKEAVDADEKPTVTRGKRSGRAK